MAGRRSIVPVLVGVGMLSAACSGGPGLPSLPGPGLTGGPMLADLPKLSVPALSGERSQIAESSAEVYSRVARGANRCWFGPSGRLGKTHLLHADAAPSLNGGAVEVVVHERAVDQPKPWGYKAFRVLLTESSSGGTTSIDVENARIPDAEAARMRAEVFKWVGGEEGCTLDPALDKVEPAVAAAPPPAPAKSATRKVRPKSTAAGGPEKAATK